MGAFLLPSFKFQLARRTGLGKFSISWPMATGIAPEIPVTYVTYVRSPWLLSTKVHSTSGFD